MQSVILNFFSKIFKVLAVWFDESRFGKTFNRLAATLANIFTNSTLGRLFVDREWGHLFKESIFYKVLTMPVALCRRFAARTETFSKDTASASGIVWFLSNWSNISFRIYGIVLCSFSVCYGLLRAVFFPPSLFIWCCIGAMFLLSLLCMTVNRSLKSLFKGSSILTGVGSLFCYIKKDADSKLFLKDPEILTARPIYGIVIGAILGALASVLPINKFILILGATLYIPFVLRYTLFGVYTIIIAAPVLPTMVLAGGCCLTIVSFFLKIATNKDYSLRPVPLGGYIAMFVLTLVLGTLHSYALLKSCLILFLHLAFILFYFVAFQTLDTKKKWRGALICFLVTSAFVALYGIFQNFANIVSTETWLDEQMFSQIKMRVYSTFDNPNVLGEYLVLLIPIAAAVIWRTKTNGKKTIFAGILLALCTCIILTWSRGAWLGVCLAIAVFLLIMDKRWSLLVILGILLLPMLFGSNSAIATRLFSIGNTADTSTAYRVSIWQASVKMLKDIWASGIGPGSDAFASVYPRYALMGADFALHAHNLFLQLCVELGICGIITFLAMIFAFIRQSFSLSVYQNRSRLSQAVSIALASGLLGFLFQGLTDNVWYNYKMVLLFWIILAFAGSASAPDFNNTELVNGGDQT